MNKSLRWKFDTLPESVRGKIMGVDIIKETKISTKPVKSKYGNRKCEFNGIKFDSQKERDHYQTLLLLQKNGTVKTIELQPEYPYICRYVHPEREQFFDKRYKYIADFRVTYADGHVETVDVKGMKTKEFKRKQVIVEKLYNIKLLLP